MYGPHKKTVDDFTPVFVSINAIDFCDGVSVLYLWLLNLIKLFSCFLSELI